MRTVLVTGASGFISGYLAPILKRSKWRVIGVARHEMDGFDNTFVAGLGESILPILRNEKIDAIVHCANAVGDNEFMLNVDGTKRWLDEGRECGVKSQILLGSLSAQPDSYSEYGRAKYLLEQYFISAGQIVLRPGLVVGNGGLFARIIQPMQKAKVVPLLDNGKSKVYVTGVDFLCSVIRDALNKEPNTLGERSWSIQQSKAFTLREIMETIRKVYGYKCSFLPVPSFPVQLALQVIETIPFLQLPITSANVKGLRQNSNIEHPCDYAHFGYPEESLDELIKKAKLVRYN